MYMIVRLPPYLDTPAVQGLVNACLMSAQPDHAYQHTLLSLLYLAKVQNLMRCIMMKREGAGY